MITGRDESLEEVFVSVEKDFEFLGITAIEDKLQVSYY